MGKKPRAYDGKTTEAKVRERRYPKRLTVKVISEGRAIREERTITFPTNPTDDTVIRTRNPHKRVLLETRYFQFAYYDNDMFYMIAPFEKRPEYFDGDTFRIAVVKLLREILLLQVGRVPKRFGLGSNLAHFPWKKHGKPTNYN